MMMLIITQESPTADQNSVRVLALDMLDSLTGVNVPPRIAIGLLVRASELVLGKENCRVPEVEVAGLPGVAC